MKRIGTLLVLVCAFAWTAAAQETSLPPPPDGFRWERAPEVKAAFLVPDGWFFKRETQKKTLGYFATREDIDEDGRFLAGLTINVVPRLSGRDAAAYANTFIDAFPNGKRLIKSWDASMGPFVGAGCRTRDEVVTMHTLMLANPTTNTLYLFIFEAPNSEWDSVWNQYGHQMMKLLLIDDEM